MNIEKDLNEITQGLQTDLLKMIEDDDSENFDETEATNNFNNSDGKENDSFVNQTDNGEKKEKKHEFNFDDLGKELELGKNVRLYLTQLIFIFFLKKPQKIKKNIKNFLNF